MIKAMEVWPSVGRCARELQWRRCFARFPGGGGGARADACHAAASNAADAVSQRHSLPSTPRGRRTARLSCGSARRTSASHRAPSGGPPAGASARFSAGKANCGSEDHYSPASRSLRALGLSGQRARARGETPPRRRKDSSGRKGYEKRQGGVPTTTSHSYSVQLAILAALLREGAGARWQAELQAQKMLRAHWPRAGGGATGRLRAVAREVYSKCTGRSGRLIAARGSVPGLLRESTDIDVSAGGHRLSPWRTEPPRVDQRAAERRAREAGARVAQSGLAARCTLRIHLGLPFAARSAAAGQAHRRSPRGSAQPPSRAARARTSALWRRARCHKGSTRYSVQGTAAFLCCCGSDRRRK